MKYTKMVGAVINELAMHKLMGGNLTAKTDRYIEMLESDGFEFNEARGMVSDLIDATMTMG